MAARARFAFAVTPAAAVGFGHGADLGALDAAFGAFDAMAIYKVITMTVATAAVFPAVRVVRVRENTARFMARQAVVIHAAMMEAAHRREAKRVVAQAEAEAHIDAAAKITEAKAGAIHSVRRQRRPAAVIAVAAPRHPGRTPNAIGNPEPPAMAVMMPAPIMKRRPAPTVIRAPIPTGVSPHPIAARAIRTPAAISDGDRRLPAPAVVARIVPTAVRRQSIVEVGDRFGLGIDDRLWLLHDHSLRFLLNDDLLIGIWNVVRRYFNLLRLRLNLRDGRWQICVRR